MKQAQSPYRRVLLKLSGEALVGQQAMGIDGEACITMARRIKEIADQGVEVGLVIGGGNIFRGIKGSAAGMARTPADQIGMLATLMNGIALQQALEALQCPSIVLSALDCPKVVESFTLRRAQEALKQKLVCLFVGGTGNPYFTTDTAAALRACEIGADALLKATKVDGVYSKDPVKFSDAVKYNTISYSQVLAEKLEVMDATSVALCMKAQIPIVVFNMQLLDEKRLLEQLSKGEQGTVISGG